MGASRLANLPAGMPPLAARRPGFIMDVEEIKALIAVMSASDLTEMQVEKDGWLLRLSRGGAPVAGPPVARGDAPAGLTPPPARRPADAAAAESGIRSPLAGIVYFSPSPDRPPFVRPGAVVQVGDIVCLVEAMKMFNELRADRAGTVEALFAATGDEVEAGQLLVRIV